MSTTATAHRSATAIDTEMLAEAHVLAERARSLRSQAAQLDGVLAATYRRRASELELESFVMELQSGLPYAEVHAPAA